MLNSILWENGGTCSVTRNPQFRDESPYDMHAGLVPRMGRCKYGALSNIYVGLVSHMVKCKCIAFLTCMLDWFLAWSNVSARPF